MDESDDGDDEDRFETSKIQAAAMMDSLCEFPL
jgi:hypothetical protein